MSLNSAAQVLPLRDWKAYVSFANWLASLIRIESQITILFLSQASFMLLIQPFASFPAHFVSRFSPTYIGFSPASLASF